MLLPPLHPLPTHTHPACLLPLCSILEHFKTLTMMGYFSQGQMKQVLLASKKPPHHPREPVDSFGRWVGIPKPPWPDAGLPLRPLTHAPTTQEVQPCEHVGGPENRQRQVSLTAAALTNKMSRLVGIKFMRLGVVKCQTHALQVCYCLLLMPAGLWPDVCGLPDQRLRAGDHPRG